MEGGEEPMVKEYQETANFKCLSIYNGQYFMDWGGYLQKYFSIYNGHFLREKQGSA